MSNPFDAYKQTKDYNCGPAAVAYMLRTHENHPLSIDEITERMGSTNKDGTSHEQIEEFLRHRGYTFSSGVPDLFTMRLPMLVNYQAWGDGHYGVMLNLTIGYVNSRITLFDPADGRIITASWPSFVNGWFSARYGAKWGLWNLYRRDSVVARHATED